MDLDERTPSAAAKSTKGKSDNGKSDNGKSDNGRPHNGRPDNGSRDARPGPRKSSADTGPQARGGNPGATTAAGGHRTKSRPSGAGRADRNDQQARLAALLNALRAARQGDFRVRLSLAGTGTGGAKGDGPGSLLSSIADEFNAMVAINEALAVEMVRVEQVVGREGRMTERATLHELRGGWGTSIGSINALIGDLVQPTTEVARVISAVAEGDFTQKMAMQIEGQPVKGEFLRIGTTVNSMVDQLSSFAAEVTRVAKEVGTDGKLGGQAEVPDAAGIWRDLTDNVNQLANNLTAQVRNIAEVTTSVAKGDLSKKITVDARGEVLELKNTVNTMVDQLNSFAAEVTRVAKEVGTDGKLGGQADVKGVSGVWKDLTDNVNFMASNLTTQVRGIVKVVTAVANGDLGEKLQVNAKGEIAALGDTLNNMTKTLGIFAQQVTSVARTVGVEGKLGAQAEVPGVAGTWKDLTDNVNLLANNLTAQVRNIAEVTTSVAKGDLSKKITVDVRGEVLELKDTINTMVDQLNSFAAEVTRVAKEVGTEGKLGGQADVKGVSGTWKNLTDNVNFMASNLTGQVRNIALVTTAVANGDLSRTITVDAKGEVLELKNTINTMVDQLNSFAAEVTRVAKEVGTEGKLGGQAEVKGVAGTWKDLTDNVNFMATNLTTQVRGIARVVTAVANGDLSQRLKVEAKGEIAALSDTINGMTDTLGVFAEQVTDVARTVGVEGKLGAQAEVPGVAGTWKDLTDNVNLLANNLTAQVRNIADVTTSVAKGDLSKKITVDAKGEVLELKSTINTMVDQLNSFAAEVTRVAKEVGTEGKLGGQAEVTGVSGVWKDLTDNVNFMASNLTMQVRGIVKVVTAVANGDLSKTITVDAKGEVLELKSTINTMVDQLNSFASEVTRVAKEVGTEGKLGGQAEVPGVAGVWKNLTDNVNFMARNLTAQVRGIVKVVTAVANGDLKQKMVVEAKGEIAALAETINSMTDTLSTFADQVSTVAREVGVDGKLGGQARVPGVAGTWKDLTDNVNFMASNLTTQVRGIVKVVTAVANGDLSQKLIGVEAKGEIAALADTINNMCDTLGTFADQVSTVAREVGIEGKLGGQAKVPGAVGTWRQLTDNVNQLAGNLTTQVRAISEVATAVTKGDLTRSIDVQAEGEVASLKDKINQMIVNLKETTQKNTEQDWLKTNLAKFSSMMQGQKNLETVSQMIMSQLTPLVSAHHGAFFMIDTMVDTNDRAPELKLTASYAYRERKTVASRFRFREGLVGQCAFEKKTILLTRVPPNYIQISSGLGEAAPLNIIVLPVLFEGEIKGVIELASFHPFSAIHQLFLDQLMESIGVVLNMISANMRTEELLQQSQSLTQELQSQSSELTQQQDELKRTNAALEKQALELEEKARLLAEQNTKVEVKNREVEQARVSLEEKAEQLSLISKYKSEFLANMSHELRTPLNSLLILAKLLSDNPQANLTDKQVEYAKTIYASGGDLLTLINEILDLSKVEAGKMPVEPREITIKDVTDFVERSFRPVADQKQLGFRTEIGPGGSARIVTDPQRLQQVLKNLLANAFKFTEAGGVTLRVQRAKPGTRFVSESLAYPERVIAFSVIDTGIGIGLNKQKLIFEAFQQADGTTSRKYGGTGLGLSISREIARLLGGEIQVESRLGEGSTFTLYLPERYANVDAEVEEDVAPRSFESSRAWPGPQADATAPAATPDPALLRPIDDDRDQIAPGDRVLLIIEDDLPFAHILLALARENGYKAVVAPRGDLGLTLANQLQPDAISLDLQLPIFDGWSVLDRLKRNPATRHIPVQVISVDQLARRGASLGAFAHLEKPVSREHLQAALQHISTFLDRSVRQLLLVEDDDHQRDSIIELVGEGDDVQVTAVRSAEEALTALDQRYDEGQEGGGRGRGRGYDCMVIDLVLPGDDGVRLVERIKSMPRYRDLPIVVYTGKELTEEDEQRLRKDTHSIILKSGLHSPERLLKDTALFLHRIDGRLPDRSRAMITESRKAETAVAGHKVLVIDDDVRNIFAMTSILEANGVKVTYADNGRAGIDALENDPDVDLILIDIMMPGMDGYQTIAEIRSIPRFCSIPIVAVTAKALPEDRDKCLGAGASDYLPKPVDATKLLDVIRLWADGRAEALA